MLEVFITAIRTGDLNFDIPLAAAHYEPNFIIVRTFMRVFSKVSG